METNNQVPRPPKKSFIEKLVELSEGLVKVSTNISIATLKLLGPFLIIQAIFYPKETKAWVKEYWPQWHILGDYKEPEKKTETVETVPYKSNGVRSEKSTEKERVVNSTSHKIKKNRITKKRNNSDKNRIVSKIEIFEVDGQQQRFRKFEIDKNTTKHLAIPDSLDFEEVDKSEFSLRDIQAKAKRLGVKTWTYHRVLPGDSLMVVAQKYGMTKHDIMQANYRVHSISRRGEYLIVPYPANAYRKMEER